MTFAIFAAILGLVLIYLEFFLPGAILGVSGGVLVIASVFIFVFLVRPSVLSLVFFIFILSFAIFSVVKLALKILKNKSDKNVFYLNSSQEGFIASEHQKKLYGTVGVAASDLKPSGHIIIDGSYYQAVSKHGYIKKNEKVLVEGGEGARLIVKKIN